MCTNKVLTDSEWDTVFGMVYDSYITRIIRCLQNYNTLSLREERLVLDLIYLSHDAYNWDEAKHCKSYTRRVLADLAIYVSDGAFRLDYLPAPNCDLADKEEIVTMNGSERSIVLRVGGRMNMPNLPDQYLYYLMRLTERAAEMAAGKKAADMISFANQMLDERNVLTADYERFAKHFESGCVDEDEEDE